MAAAKNDPKQPATSASKVKIANAKQDRPATSEPAACVEQVENKADGKSCLKRYMRRGSCNLHSRPLEKGIIWHIFELCSSGSVPFSPRLYDLGAFVSYQHGIPNVSWVRRHSRKYGCAICKKSRKTTIKYTHSATFYKTRDGATGSLPCDIPHV